MRWLTARCFLRELLGGLTGASPDGVELATGDEGKPFLPEARELCFSLSHSGSLAGVAVAAGREVGIDLERLRPVKRADLIAARAMSPDERRALGEASAGDDRSHAFLRSWVANEALVKAWGRSVAAVADASSRLGPAAAPGGIRVATDDNGRIWSVAGISAPDGYVAAVAAEGRGLRVVTAAPLPNG